MEGSILNISITSLPRSISNESTLILNDILSCINSQKPEKIDKLVQELKTLNTSPEILLKLGHLLYKTNFYSFAESIYKSILPLLSGSLHREALFGLGQVSFDLKKYTECHMTFSIINEFYQDFEFIDLITYKLAYVSVIFNEYQNSLKYIKKILLSKDSCNGIIVETLVLLSHIKKKQGKLNESLKICKRAMKIWKNFKVLTCFMVLVLEKSPQVVDHISKIILRKDRNSGEWSDVCFLRALSYIQQNQLDQAELLLKEQISSFPNNYLYLEYLGITYLKKEEIYKALNIFYKVKLIRPYDSVNLNNLAFCFKHFGDKEEALRILTVIDPSENQEVNLKKLNWTKPELEILAFPTND